MLGLFLNGEAIPTPGPRGEQIVDDSFLVLFNAYADDRAFTLPRARLGETWELEFSHRRAGGRGRQRALCRAAEI